MSTVSRSYLFQLLSYPAHTMPHIHLFCTNFLKSLAITRYVWFFLLFYKYCEPVLVVTSFVNNELEINKKNLCSIFRYHFDILTPSAIIWFFGLYWCASLIQCFVTGLCKVNLVLKRRLRLNSHFYLSIRVDPRTSDPHDLPDPVHLNII